MKTIFTCCCLIIVLFGETSSQERCFTPDNKNGICIPLRNCAPLFRIILNFAQSTPDQQNYIQRSQCGFNGLNPLICCEQTSEVEPGDGVSVGNWNILPKPGVCGSGSEEKIVGGTKALITDFPWMALIQYSLVKQGRQNKGYLCGGSLINKDYVITAAHCVAGQIIKFGWKPTTVRLGEHDFRTTPDCDGKECADPEMDVSISEIIMHEDYVPFSKTQYNDIALIRLSQSVQFTAFIKPVCLPIASHLKNINYDNQDLIVAGFGRTENGRLSNFKLKLGVPGFNWDRCNSVYQQSTGVSLISTQMCAGGEKDKDSCTGDSGGPLISVDNSEVLPYTYLAGIVSRGPTECGTKDFPGVYTRVDQYLDWIVRNMKE